MSPCLKHLILSIQLKKEQVLKLRVEEIAFKLGYINSEQLKELIKSIGKNQYGSYLDGILNGI